MRLLGRRRRSARLVSGSLLMGIALVLSGCFTTGPSEEHKDPATVLRVSRVEWETGVIVTEVVATVRGLTPQTGERFELSKVGAPLGVGTVLSVSDDLTIARIRLEEESTVANLGSLIAVSDLLEATRYDGEVLQTGASGNIDG